MKYKKRTEWTKLDNASKIFPATCNNKDTKVFRLSCELYDYVDPAVLQQSLDLTLESFPLYKSVLRRGVFWYYFESSDINPQVEIESNPLCSPIYIKDKRDLLFRVFYYNKRINVEIFHALSDGAGATWFMETLIYHYIIIKHKKTFEDKIPKMTYSASISQKMDDSFGRYYNGETTSPTKDNIKKISRAYQIKGNRIDEKRIKLIEGSMSVKEVLSLTREYNTTLTVFLASLLIYSIYKEMPAKMKKRPIVLSVPINLRQFYESSTARNFFSTMNISYDFKNNGSEFQKIVQYIGDSFKKSLNKEELDKHLNKLVSLEKNPFTRVIPLTLKDLSLRIADMLNDRKITSSISNIGKINLPIEFDDYINQFSVCVSARRPLITLCSYKDKLVISFTSPFEETDIQRTFFQFLSEKGIAIEILSNI